MRGSWPRNMIQVLYNLVHKDYAHAAREKVKELSLDLRSITQLYNEYAVTFELWEPGGTYFYAHLLFSSFVILNLQVIMCLILLMCICELSINLSLKVLYGK